MPGFRAWLVSSFAAIALLTPSAVTQDRPPLVGDGGVAANERFVFVVRDGVLFKFDVETLALLGSVPLPPKGIAKAPAPRQTDGVDVAVVHEHAAGTDLTATIGAAVQWLCARQDENGRWDSDGFMKHDGDGKVCDGGGSPIHDVGDTALACLLLLGDGNTLRTGPHKDELKKGIAWLREQQQENGLVGTAASHDFIYDHAIATVALCEAYGLSNYKLLRSTAQKAIDYLESHRNPYAVWRYQARDNDNDTSVTTWATWAYASARQFGLTVNAQAFDTIATWYDQVTDLDGRTGYTKVGESSSRMPGDHATRFPVENGEALTAAGLFARFLLGQSPQDKPIMQHSAALLAKKPPHWAADSIDPYYWMFGTMAMYQMGGEAWDQWQGRLGEIATAQRQDGNFAGSWDPVGVWDMNGGRIYSTAMNALALLSAQRAAKLVK